MATNHKESPSFKWSFVAAVQSVTFRFRNFSVSKLFHFFYGIGIGFGNFWYRKKYWYRFRKNLVSEKVSVSVLKIFGIEKSIGIGFDFLASVKVLDSVSFRFWVSSHGG